MSEKNIHKIFCQEFKPQCAIVVYTKDENDALDNCSYVEFHTLLPDGTLGPGQPITRAMLEGIAQIAKSVAEKSTATIKHVMPDNVLFHDCRAGHNLLGWYEPARRVQMKLSIGKRHKTFMVPMPPMLFVAKGGHLDIYALRPALKEKRPDENTKLYRAPVWNTSDDGSVCMGDIAHPDKVEDIVSCMEEWSRGFWSGIFTHSMGKTIAKGEIPALYARLHNKRQFDYAQLIPNKVKTIKELLKKA